MILSCISSLLVNTCVCDVGFVVWFGAGTISLRRDMFLPFPRDVLILACILFVSSCWMSELIIVCPFELSPSTYSLYSFSRKVFLYSVCCCLIFLSFVFVFCSLIRTCSFCSG